MGAQLANNTSITLTLNHPLKFTPKHCGLPYAQLNTSLPLLTCHHVSHILRCAVPNGAPKGAGHDLRALLRHSRRRFVQCGRPACGKHCSRPLKKTRPQNTEIPSYFCLYRMVAKSRIMCTWLSRCMFAAKPACPTLDPHCPHLSAPRKVVHYAVGLEWREDANGRAASPQAGARESSQVRATRAASFN